MYGDLFFLSHGEQVCLWSSGLSDIYNKLAKIPSAGTPGKVMREERQRNQLGSGEKERERGPTTPTGRPGKAKKPKRSFCHDSKPEFSRKEETQSLAR
jgi:hypothetical protein